MHLKIVRVLTKSWICCRTMPMPRSSEAFNSSTILPMLPPYICLATARIVDVLPVPGGPCSKRWGRRFSLTKRLTAAHYTLLMAQKAVHPASKVHILVSMISLWAATSSSDFGLNFSTHGASCLAAAFLLSALCAILSHGAQNSTTA